MAAGPLAGSLASAAGCGRPGAGASDLDGDDKYTSREYRYRAPGSYRGHGDRKWRDFGLGNIGRGRVQGVQLLWSWALYARALYELGKRRHPE